jgi:hypothetical protein
MKLFLFGCLATLFAIGPAVGADSADPGCPTLPAAETPTVDGSSTLLRGEGRIAEIFALSSPSLAAWSGESALPGAASCASKSRLGGDGVTPGPDEALRMAF